MYVPEAGTIDADTSCPLEVVEWLIMAIKKHTNEIFLND
jgi:hypothetical protein